MGSDLSVYTVLRTAVWQSSGSLPSASRAAICTPAQASARPYAAEQTRSAGVRTAAGAVLVNAAARDATSAVAEQAGGRTPVSHDPAASLAASVSVVLFWARCQPALSREGLAKSLPRRLLADTEATTDVRPALAMVDTQTPDDLALDVI